MLSLLQDVMRTTSFLFQDFEDARPLGSGPGILQSESFGLALSGAKRFQRGRLAYKNQHLARIHGLLKVATGSMQQ